MIKRLSFGIVILAVSMACGRGSSPTSPSPVAATPPPPTASTPRVVAVTITASRDTVFVNYTAVLFANAHYDDGTSAPISPTSWETSSGVVTLLTNGPVAFATGQGVGTAVITAQTADQLATQTITVIPGYPPPPR